MLFGTSRPAAIGAELAADPDTDVEHEFKLEQAEIASAPSVDTAEVVEDLRARRRELCDAAAERGVRVAALGSSPIAIRPTATPDERYERMHHHFGLVARDQLTCGLHVHVSVQSRAEGIVAIDRLRSWLPVLIAVSANSPYWEGVDSGYASYRRISWGRFPTSGPTGPFSSPEVYDAELERLVALGGALDVGMIYFDARLSAKYPTVEIRVADVVQHVDDSGALAALCRALVDTAVDAEVTTDVDVGVLRTASWYAARFGLSGSLCDVSEGRLRPSADVVDRLLDGVGPALQRNGDRDLVDRVLARLFADGTGADLQRRDGSPSQAVTAAVARTASVARTA